MTAANVIGSTIYSKGNVVSYRGYPEGEFYKTYKTGENIGLVYSWVTRNGDVWWELQDSKGTYYVKHGEDIGDREYDYAKEKGISIDDNSWKSISDQIGEAKQTDESNNSWFKKYGTILLFSVLFVISLGFISSIFKQKKRR